MMETTECIGTEAERRSRSRVNYWGIAWAASLVAVPLTVDQGWLGAGLPAVLATAASTVLGVVMLFAFRRSLRDADELRRKIELDAIAFAFGVGAVGGSGYRVLESVGAVADADFMHVLVAMMLTYALTLWLGYRSYR